MLIYLILVSHLSPSLAFIFSRSFLLRTAPHYLNAWNRLWLVLNIFLRGSHGSWCHFAGISSAKSCGARTFHHGCCRFLFQVIQRLFAFYYERKYGLLCLLVLRWIICRIFSCFSATKSRNWWERASDTSFVTKLSKLSNASKKLHRNCKLLPVLISCLMLSAVFYVIHAVIDGRLG